MKTKLANLKSFILFDMQWLIEEHDEALNTSKYNGTIKIIE